MGMREKLIDLLDKVHRKPLGKEYRERLGTIADHLIANDVVQVVRCKDCKHYMTIHCTCDGCCISDDWYCADGERRTDER